MAISKEVKNRQRFNRLRKKMESKSKEELENLLLEDLSDIGTALVANALEKVEKRPPFGSKRQAKLAKRSQHCELIHNKTGRILYGTKKDVLRWIHIKSPKEYSLTVPVDRYGTGFVTYQHS